jgi:selenide, water dikinase
VSEFATKWEAFKVRAARSDGPRRIAVIGGGAAGVELVLAARYGLRRDAERTGHDPNAFSFVLIAGGAVLPGQVARAQTLARDALDRAGVRVIEHDPALAMTPNTITLQSGRVVEMDATLVSTRAKAPQWLRNSGLTLDCDGFILTRTTLQAVGHDRIFAVGDCATIEGHPRPKSGVFAVRQGPAVTRNLANLMAGLPLQPHIPQSKFLSLISLGEKSAIASRGGWVASGRWAWAWKDHIDRAFMRQFQG